MVHFQRNYTFPLKIYVHCIHFHAVLFGVCLFVCVFLGNFLAMLTDCSIIDMASYHD
jgi:hypothetical protein